MNKQWVAYKRDQLKSMFFLSFLPGWLFLNNENGFSRYKGEFIIFESVTQL